MHPLVVVEEEEEGIMTDLWVTGRRRENLSVSLA